MRLLVAGGDECFSIDEIAERAVAAGAAPGPSGAEQHIDNPRVEAGSHYHNPKNNALLAPGLRPRLLTAEVLISMINWVATHRERIDRQVVLPTVHWTPVEAAAAGAG